MKRTAQDDMRTLEQILADEPVQLDSNRTDRAETTLTHKIFIAVLALILILSV